MKTRKQKLLVGSFLALLLIVLTIGRVRISNERNFTLAKGETISGPLLIMGQTQNWKKGLLWKVPSSCCAAI